MEAQIKIDDGFSKEDLSQPAYANRLAEICAIINAQNLCLLRRLASRDFDPAKELDRSANGAASYLHDLVATIVLYEEGRVPWQVAKSMCESTAALLTALQELPNAPIGELDKAGVAFRLLLDIASRYYPQPSVHRDKYEESLFKAEEQVNSALDKLHEKYVEMKFAKKAPKPPKMRHHRRDAAGAIIPRKTKTAQENFNRVFTEIDRLVKKGYSIRAALRLMRNRGTYNTYMGNRSLESWRRYYYKRLEKRGRFGSD